MFGLENAVKPPEKYWGRQRLGFSCERRIFKRGPSTNVEWVLFIVRDMRGSITEMEAEIEGLWKPSKASDVLGVPEERLIAWRARGVGPRFIKLRSSPQAQVRYEPSAIRAFIEQGRVED